MRIVIACGGTGGHLFPGLAVAEELQAQGHELLILISRKHVDALATQGRTEFNFERLPSIGYPGLNPRLPLFFWELTKGLVECNRVFARFKPDAVLGMGGFTSLTPLMCGNYRGARTLVHESNAIPGKANKLNAKFCRRVLVGLEACAKFFPADKVLHTGTPIRTELRQPLDRAAALAHFGLDAQGGPVLLVVGGSQGAHGVNMALKACAEAGIFSGGKAQLIHLSGAADEAELRAAYEKAGVRAHVAAFCHEMGLAYTAANLAIARSGASTLTELSAFGLPAVLIPLPTAAEDHQTRNAEIYANAGAAVLLPQKEATPQRMGQLLSELLGDPARLQAMSAATLKTYLADAPQRIAAEVVA
jgi:UDP-N-acetylglucosamine--N-acetylmuramyl-(pentapeptide) pyrophosphoryl-undecaprenol N-acetylglucosamine transferase